MTQIVVIVENIIVEKDTFNISRTKMEIYPERKA
jgi:hypothetical protein